MAITFIWQGFYRLVLKCEQQNITKRDRSYLKVAPKLYVEIFEG